MEDFNNSLSTLVLNDLPTCANCHKKASQTCSGCSETPSYDAEVENTQYCSIECQKIHWKQHKEVCKNFQMRKSFYRAADVLQDIFYLYRENMFDRVIVKIEEKDGKLYVYDSTERTAANEETPLDLIKEFPYTMMASQEDGYAVLAALACTDSVVWLHEIEKYLLSDLSETITEVVLKVKNPKRVVVSVDIDEDGEQDNTGFAHEILKVKLKNGETYALDLSGAQFGYYEPVTPWASYESRISSIIQDRYFGEQRENVKKDSAELGDRAIAYVDLNLETSDMIKIATQIWESTSRTTVAKLLLQRRQTFEQGKKDLVEEIDRGLQAHIRGLRSYHAARE